MACNILVSSQKKFLLPFKITIVIFYFFSTRLHVFSGCHVLLNGWREKQWLNKISIIVAIDASDSESEAAKKHQWISLLHFFKRGVIWFLAMLFPVAWLLFKRPRKQYIILSHDEKEDDIGFQYQLKTWTIKKEHTD